MCVMSFAFCLNPRGKSCSQCSVVYSAVLKLWFSVCWGLCDACNNRNLISLDVSNNDIPSGVIEEMQSKNTGVAITK